MKRMIGVLLPLLLVLMCAYDFKQLDNKRKINKVPVIFDTDMGNDIDDVLALVMLYNYVDMGYVDLLGIGTSKDHPFSVKYLDVLNTWYHHSEIPLGVMEQGPELDSIMAIPRYLTTVVNMKKEGKPMFNRSIKDYSKLMYTTPLYRKLLSESSDGSVVFIMVGMASNLAKLLKSGPDQYSALTGTELVNRKVNYLCMMGGNFAELRPECNIVTDSAASRIIFNEWPTKIIISPFEIGSKIRYPAGSFANDFNFVDHHPLLEAKKWYSEILQDSPTWDVTCVLYVAEKDSGYFTLSGPGQVTLGWEPEIQHHIVTRFAADPTGKRFYLKASEAQRKMVQKRFLEIIPRDPNRIRLPG